MKRKMGRNAMLVLACALAAALVGCGSASGAVDSSDMESESYTNSQEMMATDEMYDASSDMVEDALEETTTSSAGTQDTLAESVASNRKLIKRVNMSVETQEFDKLTANIEAKVEALGGYMESSNLYGSSISYDTMKRADYTARIPVNKLGELVSAVSDSSNVTSKSESATDVTLSYVDTKSQKEAYDVELERLMEILKQAQDVETIVALESRMTEVRYQIQSLESQLRTYDNLVDYATVSIHIDEVEIYTPVVVAEKTDFQRMTEGFQTSLYRVGSGFKNFGIGFVIALPYLFVWALIILVIIGIVRVICRKKKRKREMGGKTIEQQTENKKREEQE